MEGQNLRVYKSSSPVGIPAFLIKGCASVLALQVSVILTYLQIRSVFHKFGLNQKQVPFLKKEIKIQS